MNVLRREDRRLSQLQQLNSLPHSTGQWALAIARTRPRTGGDLTDLPSGLRPGLLSLATNQGWLVACLTSQQHASVSQGRICSDNCTFCHTETSCRPTIHLIQSQNINTGPTSPSASPVTPGAWQGSHRSANF